MCGLFAVVERSGKAVETTALKRALDQMQRRGPEDEGIWEEQGVKFGHRCLAISGRVRWWRSLPGHSLDPQGYSF